MNKFQKQIGENVIIEVSGKKFIKGLLIDAGNDVVVIFNGKDFIYAPTFHIQNFRINDDEDDYVEYPNQSPEIIKEMESEISLRKILMQGRGMFVEIYVTGSHSIHGYVTSIMNDYFVFYSPVNRSMYIKISHLKWIVPYQSSIKPYDLSNAHLPLQPDYVTLSRTFQLQLEKFIDQLVIFDIGKEEDFIGKIMKVEGGFVEVKPAKHQSVYLNLNHIKTFHHVYYS